jgi:hypothetical protein
MYAASALLLAVCCQVFAQSGDHKYQLGTILEVKKHPTSGPTDSPTPRYDISVKVDKTVYVVLYTAPSGTYGVQYSAGNQMLVLVGSKTITFNDQLGRSREVPILSRKTEAEQGPDFGHVDQGLRFGG